MIGSLRRAITLLTALAGLLAFVVGLTTGLATADRGPKSDGASRSASGTDTSVFVAGDSITKMSTPALRRRGLHWEVDAHGGRPVTSLGWVLGERLQRGPAPRVVVAALGSNARPGWDAVAGYRAMIAQLPATTTVVFVSVYRNPAYYTRRVARHRPDWNPRYSVAYTRAMHQIATERPHTCVAPWRSWARAHRHNLTGGVHPHHFGRKAWARIVARTVASCR
jgi:lysophospholipase L1-like esterase